VGKAAGEREDEDSSSSSEEIMNDETMPVFSHTSSLRGA
jgi:hypothetical protein